MTQATQQQKSDWLYRCQFVGVMNACLAFVIVMMEVFWTEGWIE